MKALVIGGNGFIGSHLVDALLALDWDVSVLDVQERRFDAMPPRVHFIRGELSQEFLVREALQNANVVFHLAWSTIHEIANRDPATDILANLVPTVRLIETCSQFGVGRVVFASSGGTVYGPAKRLPIKEIDTQDPITAYGITKLATEKYLQMYHHLLGLDYAVLRPSVPYGPRQNPLGRQGAVAVFLYRVAHGLPLTIYGGGSVTRDFFYISDLIDAFVMCAYKELKAKRVFNIGGDQEISLLQLVGYVERTVSKQAIIEHRPNRKFDAQRIVLDTKLANKVLGWRSRVSIEAGLDETWRWMKTSLD